MICFFLNIFLTIRTYPLIFRWDFNDSTINLSALSVFKKLKSYYIIDTYLDMNLDMDIAIFTNMYKMVIKLSALGIKAGSVTKCTTQFFIIFFLSSSFQKNYVQLRSKIIEYLVTYLKCFKFISCLYLNCVFNYHLSFKTTWNLYFIFVM